MKTDITNLYNESQLQIEKVNGWRVTYELSRVGSVYTLTNSNNETVNILLSTGGAEFIYVDGNRKIFKSQDPTHDNKINKAISNIVGKKITFGDIIDSSFDDK